MNYTIILHKSLWRFAIPLKMTMVLLGLFMLVSLTLEVWQIFNHKIKPTKFNYIFISYLVLYAFIMVINPFNFPVKPSIKYNGYWSGVTSSGQITLYSDKVFEIKWNGMVRGGNYLGKWTENKDTFNLNYFGMELDRVGNKLLYQNNCLFTVDGISGMLLRNVTFKCDEQN